MVCGGTEEKLREVGRVTGWPHPVWKQSPGAQSEFST